jgi:hypothetical protein
MTNPNKVKGDVFERAVRDHAEKRGLRAEKTRAGYARDAGDVHILADMGGVLATLQAKNHRTWCLPEWLRALTEQRTEAKAQTAALVIKRRGTGDPGQSYVVLPYDDYLDLLLATEN